MNAALRVCSSRILPSLMLLAATACSSGFVIACVFARKLPRLVGAFVPMIMLFVKRAVAAAQTRDGLAEQFRRLSVAGGAGLGHAGFELCDGVHAPAT